MPSFRVPVLGFPVCFLLPFPDSLPQLFLRCLPYALCFRSFPFRSAFFRLLLFRFWLLSLLCFLSAFFPFLPHSGSAVCQLRLSLCWFSPFFKNPVSRVFLCGSRTQLSVSFLSSFPASLPQLFHRCLPYALNFRYFPLRSAFFRPHIV